MKTKKLLLIVSLYCLSACEAEVGSDKWCKKMEGKPKGDWSMNDAGDYAKHCVLRKTSK